ncbi:hypothetical protein CBS101457_004303 [Exobasidium rhododendri]|nr:hypothetical protein CBS101457_004303 [Exobasidium rhododendri]
MTEVSLGPVRRREHRHGADPSLAQASTSKIDGIEYVTLVSSDGYHFLVDRRCALLSAPLRSTLGDKSSKQVDLGKHTATSANIAVEEPPTATSDAPTLSTTSIGKSVGDPEGYSNPFANNDDGDNDGKEDGLEGGFAEAKSNRINLPNMRGIVLEKVVEYLCWYGKYLNAKDIDIPKFEPRIMPEIALELLMASDYLDV